jgi:hypothetical protein
MTLRLYPKRTGLRLALHIQPTFLRLETLLCDIQVIQVDTTLALSLTHRHLVSLRGHLRPLLSVREPLLLNLHLHYPRHLLHHSTNF